MLSARQTNIVEEQRRFPNKKPHIITVKIDRGKIYCFFPPFLLERLPGATYSVNVFSSSSSTPYSLSATSRGSTSNSFFRGRNPNLTTPVFRVSRMLFASFNQFLGLGVLRRCPNSGSFTEYLWCKYHSAILAFKFPLLTDRGMPDVISMTPYLTPYRSF